MANPNLSKNESELFSMRILSRSFLGDNTYITYPHTNAFMGNGKGLLYCRIDEGSVWLIHRNLETGKSEVVSEIGSLSGTGKLPYLDVAQRAPRVATCFNNAIWIMDLENACRWINIYQCPVEKGLDDLVSLSADGSKLVCMEHEGAQSRAFEIHLESGQIRKLFSMDWLANHAHYSPHDEDWIAFSHEGATESIPDRCWVWHAEFAPQGRAIFDQVSDEPGKLLCVGHERWGWHDISGYVVAYAVSPARKRGLYEIFADGRPARLLWENDVLWHCNMDPSGRFAVVDTTGPFQRTSLAEHVFREALDRHLQTDRERGWNTSEVVLIDLKTEEFIHVATVGRTRHPFHPHPAISPDRRWLIWNDDSKHSRGAWLAELDTGVSIG